MENKNIIYALCERSGEVRYVGKSTSGIKRPRDHLRPSKYEKLDQPVYRWIRKRAKQDYRPIIKILAVLDNPEELFEEEIFMISYLKSLGANLLNMTDGGEGALGRVNSAETKQKMSEVRKAAFKDPTQAVIYAEALKKNMANPDTRRKMAEGCQKRWADPEEKAKQSARKKGCRQYHYEKPIVDQNGAVYESVSIAAKTLNIPRTSISSHLQGRAKHARGYTFNYLTKDK